MEIFRILWRELAVICGKNQGMVVYRVKKQRKVFQQFSEPAFDNP